MDIVLITILSVLILALGVILGAIVTDKTWKQFAKTGHAMERADGYIYKIYRVTSHRE